MKKRFDFKSIKFILWFTFLAFAVAILGLVSFLQLFFVNNYYEDMKIEDTLDVANEITESYKSDDEETFIDNIDKIISDDDIYLRIDKGGNTIYPEDVSLSYLSEIEKAETGLKSAGTQSAKKYYSNIFTNEMQQTNYYTYAAYLDKDKTTIMYIVAPLYPVQSTVAIMRDQMFLIVIIALSLAIVLSFFISNWISNPIRRLQRSASKISQGNYEETFPEDTGSSEIKDLSHTLNAASNELRKSSELQKDLMANVSHDLRTPLTMIKSYAEMIRDLSGDIPEKRNQHIKVIMDEADRLNTLVNDVMTLSAIQSDTLKLNIKSFDIKAATESIVNTYEPLKEAQGYDFDINCIDSFMVRGDEDKIKQVISNLFTNAVKYCGEDKKIIINIKRWGRKIHFEVIDHGQGIKPSELEHIWERYYKTSTNHVRSTTGSGLGLSIVYEILALHNAKFGAESKVNKGTTIWFELDLAPEGDAESIKEKEAKKRREYILKRRRHDPDKHKHRT